MHRAAGILALAAALVSLSACVFISREHTIEREPARQDYRYPPPPPTPTPVPLR
jgi:hypothetical protein